MWIGREKNALPVPYPCLCRRLSAARGGSYNENQISHLTLRAGRIGHLFRDDPEVDAAKQVHLSRVNTHDVHARREGGVRELDLAVDSPRP